MAAGGAARRGARGAARASLSCARARTHTGGRAGVCGGPADARVRDPSSGAGATAAAPARAVSRRRQTPPSPRQRQQQPPSKRTRPARPMRTDGAAPLRLFFPRAFRANIRGKRKRAKENRNRGDALLEGARGQRAVLHEPSQARRCGCWGPRRWHRAHAALMHSSTSAGAKMSSPLLSSWTW